ncbi:hypothetical protein KIN20_003228 [Parelaphostrongylus tenuis]|uniref:Uncharacterized protein n=1 Tax=Parelaphostrongylus tenuis TaxID=148309 RepID=A0AAD5M110_PARTN|nr:hypothetical protein KIN20_003228 [Parelaphostrongylus tenuis]
MNDDRDSDLAESQEDIDCFDTHHNKRSSSSGGCSDEKTIFKIAIYRTGNRLSIRKLSRPYEIRIDALKSGATLANHRTKRNETGEV